MIRKMEHLAPRTIWQLLALPGPALEKTDLVEVNLAVAREIPESPSKSGGNGLMLV
jgi:hypothetical protein